MKPCLCQDCARPMTVEEIFYYEDRCETCTRAWDDWIVKWMRGETIEPDLIVSLRGSASSSGSRRRNESQ
jgi:hypothetical protein